MSEGRQGPGLKVPAPVLAGADQIIE
jgi:hypothetical protein